VRSDPPSPAHIRWKSLAPDAPREEYFDALREVLAEYYLAEPENPYRLSGRSSGAARWEETRRCFVDAVHRDGDFMDVGCANGLLLESLVGWCAERDLAIRPFGIDFIPELIDCARARHPGREDAFEVANAFHWRPGRRYDYVRTNLEYVPVADRRKFLNRLRDRAVAPGGRLIVAAYWPERTAEPVEVPAVIGALGFRIDGCTGAPGVSVAWSDGAGAA
jgi:SAM-dependent methyltransferase